MAPQKITRFLLQILIICLGFGCASSSTEMNYCPTVGLISDLDRVAVIEGADNKSKPDILFSSKIHRLGTKCKVSTEGITISIVFDLSSKLSRYDTPTDVDIKYLVATIDPNGLILAKEVYQTTVNFMDGVQTARNTQEVEVFMPSPGNIDLRKHKILIGFELTKSQLRYNRGLR